jgi:hypothetical protein
MLDDFQKKVVGVAFIILILIFGSTYYLLNIAAKTATWPPTINNCPDYWDYDTSNNVCVNSKGLGNASDPFQQTFDPATAVATYSNVCPSSSPSPLSTNCGKYCYAQQYQIPWGGISYGFQKMPCS